MGRDNHNAGLHYKEFARDHTALHEFDYDNEVGSRQKKNSNVIKRNEMQTAVFSTKGNLIYHDQSYWAAERKSALEEYNVRKNRQKREREMERDEKAKKGEAKHKSKVGKGTKKSVLKSTISQEYEAKTFGTQIGADPRFSDIFMQFSDK